MPEEPRVIQNANAGAESVIVQVGRDNNGSIAITFNSGEVIRPKIPSSPIPSSDRVDFNNHVGQVLEKLERHNVVQIHGLPGVGKTLLAQHVALRSKHYDLGVAWLSLRAESESLAGPTLGQTHHLDKLLE